MPVHGLPPDGLDVSPPFECNLDWRFDAALREINSSANRAKTGMSAIGVSPSGLLRSIDARDRVRTGPRASLEINPP
jgi:hypothetical protein